MTKTRINTDFRTSPPKHGNGCPGLPPSQMEAIRRFDTCRIANAIEVFDIRMRNEGFTGPELRCIFPELPAMLGYAVPCRIRCSNPPVEGHTYPDRNDWWALMETFPSPRVAVIEDIDPQPGLGAAAGEIHTAILQALHCVGVITNGSVRDLHALREMHMPAFACHVSASHAYTHTVDFGHSVRICGLEIAPGDLLYGDCHGIISIPLEIAAEVPVVAARQVEQERKILDLCHSPGFDISKLRGAVTDAA